MRGHHDGEIQYDRNPFCCTMDQSMSDQPLWTIDAMARAMNANALTLERSGPLPDAISGISIDSRTIVPGEAFFAITGDSRDGHEFVDAALKARAGVAVVAQSRRDAFPATAPLIVVPDVLEGLRALGRAARTRLAGKIIGVTGSVGKTGTKEALRIALGACGETYASAASYNNHWGVPLSLARCPASARYAVFEMGMNHPGEIEPLSRMVRPHVAIITTVEPVHLEFFDSIEGIADAKAEIFRGIEPGGAAVLNRDNPQFARLEQNARHAGVGRIVTFGEHAGADARLINVSLGASSSTVEARILGADITYGFGAPGKHLVLNSLAVLAAVALSGVDPALAARALGEMKPPAGRGARQTLDLENGSALLIDESYNANPASMRAGIALLAQAEIGPRGRRIAVLGDMLELGPRGADLHRGLAEPLREHAIDKVFCCGPLMLALWEALPSERRGGYAETSSALEPRLIEAIRPGDALMIKGSLGSRMGPIVKSLERRYARR
jgi:UDP-N-acetylmuramoyl-tripeptide--D-alanyl-D-alanine ligase